MKARRRFWSLLLAVCMILTFMPTAAFAEEDSGAQEPETKVSIPEGSATTQGESSVAEVKTFRKEQNNHGKTNRIFRI